MRILGRLVRKNTLAVRLTGTLLAAFIVLLTVKAVIQIALQEEFAKESARMSGLQLSEAIYGSLQRAMLANDRDHLHTGVRNIAARSGDLRIRVFNKEGEIVFSSSAEEQGSRVDLKSEACFKCHAADRPIERLAPGDRTRAFEVDGVPAMGVIRPIENEASCAGGGCHVSPTERRLLGVLDVTVVMRAIERRRNTTLLLMIATALGALGSTVVIVLIVVRGAVHRPVGRLRDTLEQLGQADYTVRHPPEDIAEFDRLGAAVNTTAQALQETNAELVTWAQTLERRVAAKTEELERAHEHLIQVERMASLGKLAAVVAHEINNPLSSVVTYSRLLLKRERRRDPDSDDLPILEGIAEESERCGAIVSDLLLFARRTRCRVEPADVNAIITRVLFLLKHPMDTHGVQPLVELDEAVGETLCDPSLFEQTMLALFVNAIDAMPDGGTLSIRTFPHPPDHGVRVEVEDTGVGIPDEVRANIFEPFFTTKGEQAGAGLGLGLAVVYGIVQRHHGTIDVHSAVGAGTTFTVVFPGVPPDVPREVGDEPSSTLAHC